MSGADSIGEPGIPSRLCRNYYSDAIWEKDIAGFHKRLKSCII